MVWQNRNGTVKQKSYGKIEVTVRTLWDTGDFFLQNIPEKYSTRHPVSEHLKCMRHVLSL